MSHACPACLSVPLPKSYLFFFILVDKMAGRFNRHCKSVTTKFIFHLLPLFAPPHNWSIIFHFISNYPKESAHPPFAVNCPPVFAASIQDDIQKENFSRSSTGGELGYIPTSRGPKKNSCSLVLFEKDGGSSGRLFESPCWRASARGDTELRPCKIQSDWCACCHGNMYRPHYYFCPFESLCQIGCDEYVGMGWL